MCTNRGPGAGGGGKPLPPIDNGDGTATLTFVLRAGYRVAHGESEAARAFEQLMGTARKTLRPLAREVTQLQEEMALDAEAADAPKKKKPWKKKKKKEQEKEKEEAKEDDKETERTDTSARSIASPKAKM